MQTKRLGGSARGGTTRARRFAGSFKLWWLLLNTILILYLLSRRLSGDLEGGFTSDRTCRNKNQPCDPDCGENGVCLYGTCRCNKGWSGEDCSTRACYRQCNFQGLCLNGTCICNRRYTGEACTVDVALLKEEEIQKAVSDKINRNGKIDNQIEHVVSSRSAKKYHFELCRSKACTNTWLTQMLPLIPLLPRDDVHFKFPSCAIVSSAKGIVYNASNGYQTRRETGRGEDIDKHRAIIRLNNAPTENFEKWVGRRTTHRLVEADYAEMVRGMLGTEVTLDETKSVVTPTTWWVGGYPHIEKITYLMAVFPSRSKGQIRAPDNNGYASFGEVFPGNRHYLLSPHMMNEIRDIYTKFKEIIKSKGLGCYKSKSVRVPQLFTALIYSLQVCQKVHVYGMSLNPVSTVYSKDQHPDEVLRKGSGRETTRYYEEDDDFSSRNPICDELTRTHIMRMLLKTNKVFLYE